jgi:hypothetical protein
MTALFQHRHYCMIAGIIADLNEDVRAQVALHFATQLKGTNPGYSGDRFYSAAMANPRNGRDRVR